MKNLIDPFLSKKNNIICVIVSLLSVDFIKLVGIAAIIVLPVSWWAMNEWLHMISNRNLYCL